MRIANWLALLLAPILALSALSISYALVTHVCEKQVDAVWLHAVFTSCLLLSLIFTALAWCNWRRAKLELQEVGIPAPRRQQFVAHVGFLVGLLSSLVLIAQWLPVWMLSPCIA